MKSTLIDPRRLRLATLLLLLATAAFGAEKTSSADDAPLIGSMTVTATRITPLAASLATVADLGSMTVTARRETSQTDGAMVAKATFRRSSPVLFAKNEAAASREVATP